MFEKLVFDRLLSRLLFGRVTLQYWDGERRFYGTRGPAVTIRLTTPAVARAVMVNVNLAFGEGYSRGLIEVSEDDLSTLFRIFNAHRAALATVLPIGMWHWNGANRRHRRRSQRSRISHHYDVGNDYYRLFLDPTLTYSCAYFEHDDDPLEQAQHQKINYLLRKLRLAPGHRLLDIGCGWGYLAVAAAQQYGVSALGITLSHKQLAGARLLAERADVAGLVRFELCNYQDLRRHAGSFDRVVSVGMFEHVGRGQHGRYFDAVQKLLNNGGVSVLQTITQQASKRLNPWIDRYIFPGAYLPTISEIERGLACHQLWSIERENLWRHYALTLERWRHAHRANRQKIVAMFDEQFYRIRDFWLAGSQAAFTTGDLGLAQIVFTKDKPPQWPLTRRYLYKQPAVRPESASKRDELISDGID